MQKEFTIHFPEAEYFWFKDGAEAKPEKIKRSQLDAQLAKGNLVWDPSISFQSSPELRSVVFGTSLLPELYRKTSLHKRLRLAQEQLVIVNYKDKVRGFGVEIHPDFIGKTSLAGIPYNGPFRLKSSNNLEDKSREVMYVCGASTKFEKKQTIGAFLPKPRHVHYASLMHHAPGEDELRKIHFSNDETRKKVLISGDSTVSQEVLNPVRVPLITLWPLKETTDSRYVCMSYGWQYFATREMPMFLTDKETGEFLPASQESKQLYVLPKFIPVEHPTDEIQTIQVPGVVLACFLEDINRFIDSNNPISSLNSLFIGVLNEKLCVVMPDFISFIDKASGNFLTFNRSEALLMARHGMGAYENAEVQAECVSLREYMLALMLTANTKQERISTLIDLHKLYELYGINDADRGEDFDNFRAEVSAEMSGSKPLGEPLPLQEVVLSNALIASIRENVKSGRKTASLIRQGMFLMSSLKAFDVAIEKKPGVVLLSTSVQFVPLTLATKLIIDSGTVPLGKSIRLLFCEDMLTQAKSLAESKSKADQTKALYVLSGIVRSRKKLEDEISSTELDEGVAALRKQLRGGSR